MQFKESLLPKKTGAKQLKNMAPYKNDCGQQKSGPNSVG